MTLSLEFDEQGVARVVAEGEVNFQEAVDTVKKLNADPRFQVPTRLLWDLRAGRVNIGAEEIRQFADFVSKTRTEGRGRTAVVAHDDMAFGMSRMYEILTEKRLVEVKIFRDSEAALRWLQEEI